jgi:hypothetical protein
MENVIDIDQTQLDVEWIRQPKMMRRAGKKLAKARLAYNESKADVDLVEADMTLKIKQSPEDYGLEKPTEKAVDAAVITSKQYQRAVRLMNKKKYEVDVLESYCTALDHRKRALEGCVQLLGMDLRAEPRGYQALA